MITTTLAIDFVRKHWKPIAVAVALAAAAAWAVHAVYAYGERQYQAGRAEVIAQDAIAAQQARQQADKRATDAAIVGATLHRQLDLALPKIEVTTHAAVDKIHTIYLAAPAGPDAVCVRPPGVQAELDAARTRANAAARGQL